MQWIGERFFQQARGRGWVDAATGRDVRLLFTRAGDVDTVDWDEQCSRLWALRHPLLNVLLDWGAAPGDHLFEAYERGGPVAAGGAAGERALRHVTRFLRASGVALERTRCARAVRPVLGGRSRGPNPIGVTLQCRPALRAIEEALDHAADAGPVVLHVEAPSRSGLRTLRTCAARSARLRGYVPVTPSTLRRFPGLTAALCERHVCLLDDPAGTPNAGRTVMALMAALAESSARRHVVLRFHRQPRADRRAVLLGPMGISALVGMVYADAEQGPSSEALFDAARTCEGRPGTFMDALCGERPPLGGAAQVHETHARYAVPPAAPPSHTGAQASPTSPSPTSPWLPASRTSPGGRVFGAATRAALRAQTLARNGRHAAAARLLGRALRILAARQRAPEAAACALHLGILGLDRGRPDAAAAHFTEARRIAGDHPLALTALIAVGVALTDARKLVDAEAALRASLASADALDDGAHKVEAVAALARCLYWQGRCTDALALAHPMRTAAEGGATASRLSSVLARCEVRAGRVAAAVATARRAQQQAAASDDPRARASADLALAEALLAAGDRDGAVAAAGRVVRLARTAHLPLFRVRAVLAAAAAHQDGGAHRRLRALGKAGLPPLLAWRVEEMRTGRGRASVREPVVELEALLDLSQRAADDRAGLEAICAAVGERLRAGVVAVVSPAERVLASHGRPPATVSPIVRESLACGHAVLPDGRAEPAEAAAPVRYGGEVIAALACRWTAGTPLDLHEVGIVLRAAALTAAAPVRGLLDAAVPDAPATWGDLIGGSPPAAALRDAVARAARAPFPVLIEGESGCGKELVARAIHRLGPRRDRRCCALNCAALSDDLVETELFGHTRGAFTGATTERAGLFEEADGGTLFLDEVGELSARAQAKLLRVLQEGEVRRVGENLPRRVDVRVVAATNRSLEQEAAAGRFRADLRFRLDVVRIAVPPLRQRVSDIPLLAGHFWRDAAARVGSQATLSGELLAALSRYDWPGNVRELQNVIAWIAVHSPRRGRVGPQGLPEHIARAAPRAASTLDAAREEFERRFIRAALATAHGRRARAADALGITRQGLTKMMRRLQIEAP